MATSSLSLVLHSGLRTVTRMFGGNYLKLGDSRPLPAETWVVQANGLELTGLSWPGEGEPVLLLHGLCNNAWSWARVAGLLREQRPVFAMSLRGHGRSSSPEDGYTLEATAADVVAVIQAVVGRPVHLGGHSWGGKIACVVAAQSPELVRSLTLADPVPPAGLNPLVAKVPIFINAALRAERGPFASRAEWLHAGQCVAFLRLWDEVDRRCWEASFDEQPDGAMHHRLSDAAFDSIVSGPLRQDIRAMLPDTRCAVLHLQPTFTVSFLPFELTHMRKGFARYTHVRVPGDHAFIHTNPLDTAAAMRTFLDALDRPAAASNSS